ncbi:MAG: Xaa-Pro peptidase family protein [Myxococcota bacterium]
MRYLLLVALLAGGCRNGEARARKRRAKTEIAAVDPTVPRAAPRADVGAALPPEEARGLPGPRPPIGPEVYRARRAALMAKMPRGLAVVFAKESLGEGERQDPFFYYLTGIEEEGAAVVLAPAEPLFKEMLFLKERDPEAERWIGDRAPLGRAVELSTGFARVRRAGRLPGALADMAKRAGTLVFLGPIVPYTAPVPKALEIYGGIAARTPGVGIRDASALLVAMRQRKEPIELDRIRRATAATGAGLRAAMRALRPGMREFELKEVIESGFRASGARRLAFPSIVGGGPNSAVLHYPKDDRVIAADELVVCDVGAEVDGYASDVTRTLPASGRFSDEQRRVYQAVLAAQEAAFAQVRPGARVVEDIDLAARRSIEAAGHYDHFIHGTSHFVGLEVHDVGDGHAPLVAGSVITVEPGIYIPERKLGVRIEDLLLVTETGYELLSRGIPRTIDEIEGAMAKP